MISLKPFSSFTEIEVEASISLGAHELQIEFRIADPKSLLQDGLIPGEWTSWERGDDLWKTTCFEAFFARTSEPAYWELNVSPTSLKWNLYRFDDYRKPQPPQISQDFDLMAIKVTSSTLTVRLKKTVKVENLEASLTAVIRTSGATHYYASKHAGTKPDFHLRDSFNLRT